MKLLIIGGVAGGATAAARARRVSENAEITLIERGPYVSFANCGLPYYVSGDIEKRSKLLLQTPEGFESRYRVKVLLNTEAVEIDRERKRVKLKDHDGERWIEYDKLILAQGGNPILPPLPGVDAPHVCKLWTIPDVDRLQSFIKESQPKTAVVVGGGFIGIEMAEAFHTRGISTTIIELAPQIMVTMDREFGVRIKEYLESSGIGVITGAGVKKIIPESHEVEVSDGRKIPAELVLLSVGVKPEMTLARQAGLTIGETGSLLVDEFLRTSDQDIYAAGDMIEITHRVSGKKTRIPLAGPANRQGRIAATNALVAAAHGICGSDCIPVEPMRYRGAFGTSVVKILDATAASTGLTEKAAREAGFDAGAIVIHKDHHAGYYPGGKTLTLKIVYERKTGRLLGAQAFGLAGVEKRIDVLATALAGKLTVQEIAELDLAYAPPYSSANDPVNMAAFVAANDISGFSPTITADEAAARYKPATGLILDVRNFGEYEKGHVPGSMNIPVDELRARVGEIPADREIFVHCAVGFRAHLAVRILKSRGFKQVWNVTGGYISMKPTHSFEEE